MKQILIFCIFILIGMLLLGVLPTHGEAEIYDSVVRLHVLANSDSEYDQALKLQVRDGVLAATAELLSDCATREQALEVIGANLETIRRSAQEVIEREGAGYDVTVKLCEGRIVRIEIVDKGCGIADVKQARQPLFTTDAAGERSGMGFTVMESFTDGVRVSSKPGKGTTVTMIKVLADLDIT